MDNRKFEKLIDLIINENEEQARELFHEIVVEKSRQIYESLMDEEGDMSDDLMSDISTEEEGMLEDDDELDIPLDDEGMGDEEDMGDDMGDEEFDLDSEDMGDDMGDEELEDRVVDLEEKLDQLMAEFEEEFGPIGDEEDMGDEDMGDEDMGDEDMGDEDEEALEESVQLHKVSVTHGDDGDNKKSIALTKPKVVSTGASPVKFSGGGDESGGKVSAPKTIPGTYKNAPGKGNFSEKGEAAPKPKQGDDGQNTKSPVAESRRRVQKQYTSRVKK